MSLDELLGSFFTYEFTMKRIKDEENKKKLIKPQLQVRRMMRNVQMMKKLHSSQKNLKTS